MFRGVDAGLPSAALIREVSMMIGHATVLVSVAVCITVGPFLGRRSREWRGRSGTGARREVSLRLALTLAFTFLCELVVSWVLGPRA